MDELADRIIRAMSDKLDEKFMAIGGESVESAKPEITDVLQRQIDRLDARVKDLGSRLDRLAVAACTDQDSPVSRDLRCQTCGGSGCAYCYGTGVQKSRR